MVDGAAQIAGLALIIAGARNRHKVPVYGEGKYRPVYGQNFQINPYAGGSGGGLTISGKF
jgi:hypothetical protein